MAVFAAAFLAATRRLDAVTATGPLVVFLGAMVCVEVVKEGCVLMNVERMGVVPNVKRKEKEKGKKMRRRESFVWHSMI